MTKALMLKTPTNIERRQETNDQFMKRIMNFGPFGAMQQMFILDAIAKAAKQFQSMTPEQMAQLSKDNPNFLVDLEGWAKCGKWIGDELDRHLKP